MIELSDVWDFHTDIRLTVSDRPDRARYERQLDPATCRRMGGVFSATGRLANADRDAQWNRLRAEVELIGGLEGLTVARTVGDLDGGGRQVLHAEGIYFIQSESDLDDLERLWDLGFRSLGPMYNEDNALGGGAKGDPSRGLTALGEQVFRLGWQRGFVMDAAHCNHRTRSEVIDLAGRLGRPIHFTHGHLDEPVLEYFGQRGLPREQARRLVGTGGLIGLSPHPGFVGYFDRFLAEVDFLAELAPKQTVLGSDFSGMTTPPITFPQFPSAAAAPAFARRLADRLGEPFARDFCGGTLRRMVGQTLPSR